MINSVISVPICGKQKDATQMLSAVRNVFIVSSSTFNNVLVLDILLFPLKQQLQQQL